MEKNFRELELFALHPSYIRHALGNGNIASLLEDEHGNLNGLTRACIELYGAKRFFILLSEMMSISRSEVQSACNMYLRKSTQNVYLSGAETIAFLLSQIGVRRVFAYPGTSELMFCDAIARMPGITLVNGRGDKESAFMAAGGSSLSPLSAAAILHGARGLTNAAGAIADAYRNEIATIFFVGLPSTASSRFLPPHGEKNLIHKIGGFVKWHAEITNISPKTSKHFLDTLSKAIGIARSLPFGPVLLGIPQDALETRWIPLKLILSVTTECAPNRPKEQEIRYARSILLKKKHPLIFVDDIFFRHPGAKEELRLLAETIRAPVLQIHYSRGPMLFETISSAQNPYFVGYYNPANSDHLRLMRETDLLITIEDRNMYPRVVRRLPACLKIAVTSNPQMTKKNENLCSDDLLLFGSPVDTMKRLRNRFSSTTPDGKSGQFRAQCKRIHEQSTLKPDLLPKYKHMRNAIQEAIANSLKKVKYPVLVDDSQMFGGLLANGYEIFPAKLRVFGDHGAFIGGGISFATGLAQCYPLHHVLCCIGDQSFTNGLQGFVSAVEQQTRITYLVCNNGKSVSLVKQILSQDRHALDAGKLGFIQNAPNVTYASFGKALGMNTRTIHSSNQRMKLQKALTESFQHPGPSIIELVCPSDPLFWEGIWMVKGHEEKSV